MAADTGDAADLYGQVAAAARARGVDEIEVTIEGGAQELTRFANNAIHQNVAEQARRLSVRPVIEGRTARASTNKLDRDGIRDVVEQAIAITRLTGADPDLLPLAEPCEAPRVDRFFEATARVTPRERARAVAAAIGVVEEAGQTAAGSLFHRLFHADVDELARRQRLLRRDHGALLHHGHGRGQFRLGQGQRLPPRRPGPA